MQARFARHLPPLPSSSTGILHITASTPQQFTEAINVFFDETLLQMREKFRSMVTDNFRIIAHDEHRLIR